MRFLRTNTATRVTVGPFFDKTDGVTPETGITVTSCKLTLMVDTAGVPTLVLDTAPTASGGNNDMVHVTGDDAGFYDLELAAADVNYLGRAMLAITDAAVHCPVFMEFMILPAMVYDSLVLGTDRFDANVTHIADTAQTAGDLAALVSDVPTNSELATALAAADDPVLAAIAALNNLSSAGAQAAAEAALAAYNAATEADIDALENLSAAQAQTAAAAALTAYDPPTHAEVTAAVAAGDDAMLTAIADVPTNAELATALTNLDVAVSSRSTYAGGAVASVTGAVGSVTGNVGGNVAGSVGSLAAQAKLDVNAEVDTAIADAALPDATATAVWDYVVEGAFTAKQLFRGAVAMLFGKVSGAGTTEPVVRDVSDTKNRFSWTVDEDGNRIDATVDLD